jgi:broad specificity phosphatase PhoE
VQPGIRVHLVGHFDQPLARTAMTPAQLRDPDVQQRNDDINLEQALRTLPHTLAALRLAPERPTVISHSTRVRARKTAHLLADALTSTGVPIMSVREEAALSEGHVAWDRLLADDARAAFFRLLNAILADDTTLVEDGRAVLAARMQVLDATLRAQPHVNHVWVSHAPIMPFLRARFELGLEPTAWRADHVRAWPPCEAGGVVFWDVPREPPAP